MPIDTDKPLTTLERIQREISDYHQREEELSTHRSSPPRSQPSPNSSQLSSSDSSMSSNGFQLPVNGCSPVQQMSDLVNGNCHNTSTNESPPQPINGKRRFLLNPSAKGLMQRFFKSKGKQSCLPSIAGGSPILNGNGEILLPPKVPCGMQSRKGFVPAEEKIRREVQDFESRESQLRDERKKSYPDIVALLDAPEERCVPVCSAKSLTQLNCLETEHIPAPGSLKPAKSLAELCDLDDEDVEAHRSLTLIKQFENLIQKHNEQART